MDRLDDKLWELRKSPEWLILEMTSLWWLGRLKVPLTDETQFRYVRVMTYTVSTGKAEPVVSSAETRLDNSPSLQKRKKTNSLPSMCSPEHGKREREMAGEPISRVRDQRIGSCRVILGLSQ